jgi:hypothetical protein
MAALGIRFEKPTFVRVNPNGSKIPLHPSVSLPELVGGGDTLWTRLGWLAVNTRDFEFNFVSWGLGVYFIIKTPDGFAPSQS